MFLKNMTEEMVGAPGFEPGASWLLASTSALMFLLCFLLAKNEPGKGGQVAVH